MRLFFLISFLIYVESWVLPRTLRHPTAVSATTMLDGVEIRQPIEPLGNLVLVRVKDTLTATGGGILLPDQSQEKPTEGLVIAAGPGKLHPITGVRITNPIKEGVSVLYGKFDGRSVNYNGEDCQMIRDDDVLLYYTGVTMKMDTVTPVRDYVLIKLDQKYGDAMTTKSGVMIASQVTKEDVPCEGVVTKVGEGRMHSGGEFSPSQVAVGDYVKFKDYAGNDVMIEGAPYSVVKMVDILCSLNEDEAKAKLGEDPVEA